MPTSGLADREIGGFNMAENIITFAILLVVSMVMIIIGVSQVRSKEPVGFYTGEEPPKKEQLTDMEAWNKKHGYMWIAYGFAIIAAFIICCFIKREMIALAVLFCVVIGAIPVMMLRHRHLKKKFYRS